MLTAPLNLFDSWLGGYSWLNQLVKTNGVNVAGLPHLRRLGPHTSSAAAC